MVNNLGRVRFYDDLKCSVYRRIHHLNKNADCLISCTYTAYNFQFIPDTVKWQINGNFCSGMEGLGGGGVLGNFK